MNRNYWIIGLSLLLIMMIRINRVNSVEPELYLKFEKLNNAASIEDYCKLIEHYSADEMLDETIAIFNGLAIHTPTENNLPTIGYHTFVYMPIFHTKAETEDIQRLIETIDNSELHPYVRANFIYFVYTYFEKTADWFGDSSPYPATRDFYNYFMGEERAKNRQQFIESLWNNALSGKSEHFVMLECIRKLPRLGELSPDKVIESFSRRSDGEIDRIQKLFQIFDDYLEDEATPAIIINNIGGLYRDISKHPRYQESELGRRISALMTDKVRKCDLIQEKRIRQGNN